MMIKDELLRNSKRLWASVVLCFSITRNLRLLFYRNKLQPARMRHRSIMFLVGTIGILWYILYSATILGFSSFPKNYMQRSQELSFYYFIVNHGG